MSHSDRRTRPTTLTCAKKLVLLKTHSRNGRTPLLAYMRIMHGLTGAQVLQAAADPHNHFGIAYYERLASDRD